MPHSDIIIREKELWKEEWKEEEEQLEKKQFQFLNKKYSPKYLKSKKFKKKYIELFEQ